MLTFGNIICDGKSPGSSHIGSPEMNFILYRMYLSEQHINNKPKSGIFLFSPLFLLWVERLVKQLPLSADFICQGFLSSARSLRAGPGCSKPV